MIYDPAWDMPKVNWQQQGSFEVPEIPPAYEPDAEPLVCLPAINQYWLPYVMGALDQLRNPSSWLVADDDAMYTTLARVSKLREMIGVRATCMSYLIRFDGGSCQLQQSTDGGTTWTEVEGWADFVPCLPPHEELRLTDACALQGSYDAGTTWTDIEGWGDYFGPCVQDKMPVIGLPPNPGGQTPDQLACSIAAYLANQVILEGMQAAVATVSDDLTLISMAVSISNIIPEFVLVHLFVDAVSVIYTAVSEGTLSDYEAALTSAPLWAEVTCAIYAAIVGVGYVDPTNFATIVFNLSAMTYTPTDVVTAIHGYVNAIGATGLAQLSLRAGLEAGADCSTCGAGWCTKLDFASGDQGSSILSPYGGVYTSGTGWVSTLRGGFAEIGIQVPLSTTVTVAHIMVELSTTAAGGGAVREGFFVLGGVEGATFDIDGSDTGGAFVTSGYSPAPQTVDEFYFVLRCADPTGVIILRSFEIGGDSTPYGTENCTYDVVG